MPLLTQTQNQTIAGENFIFNFNGIDAPSVGDVLITVRGIEIDTDLATERFDLINVEGVVSATNIGFAQATGEATVINGNDRTFEYTLRMTQAQFAAATGDDQLSVNVNLSPSVNLLGATQAVQVTVAYAEDRALVGATKLTGAQVLVFDVGTIVDTSGGSGAESDAIQASLASLGHTVTTAATTDSNDFALALQGKDVVVFPEFETGAFAPDAAFIAELQAFVARGGTLISGASNTGSRNIDFLNSVFGYSLTDKASASTPITNVVNPPDGHVTTFDGDPATLPANSATEATGGLPFFAVPIYTDNTGDAVVWGAGYGLGQVIQLGWDWFNAAPLGGADGGWLQVLDSAISTTADEIPADATTTATITDNGPTVVHNVNTRDDTDWFRLTTYFGVTYTFSTDDLGIRLDPFIEARTDSGFLLASDDDSGPDDDAVLTFTAGYSGLHFLTSGNTNIPPFAGSGPGNGGVRLTVTSDLIRLTPGPDNYVAGGGNDKIAALAGNDSVRGGAGDDIIFGEGGNDTLRGNEGADRLEGGDGNDLIFGNDSADTIFGDDGADQLFGNTGADRIFGGTGNDQISGNEDDDELRGGDGADSMFGGSGADVMFGDAGADLMQGDDGDDFMRGGTENDRLFGGRDNDTLQGDEGDDELNGQAGDDVVLGGLGNDRIFGIGGDDELRGNEGVDNIFGGGGNDSLFGGSENDKLFGEDGFDFLDGGAGDDKLFGGNDNDGLDGGDGDDEMFGDNGNDQMNGGNGADTLFGGAGNDIIDGGRGPGIDRAIGGSGADTFRYESGDDRLVIADFSFGQGDRVDIVGITGAQFAAKTISNAGPNALVVFGGGVGEIRFDGFNAAQVLDSWFV